MKHLAIITLLAACFGYVHLVEQSYANEDAQEAQQADNAKHYHLGGQP